MVERLEDRTLLSATVTISGASNVNEGSSYTLNVGAVTEPVDSYTIHWGDDAPDTTISAAALAAASGQVPHTYADGPNNCAITVDLDQGGSTVEDAANPLSVTVDNVAPTITGTVIALDDCNTVVTGHINFTDPGLDGHFVTINWGDGSDPDGDSVVGQTIAVEGGADTVGAVSFSLIGLHTYAAFGTYTVNATVTDFDGASSSTVTSSPLKVGATASVITHPVWGTTLDIYGTDLADNIAVSQNGGGSQITVNTNSGPNMVFAAAGIATIRLHLCDGNDQVTISNGVIPDLIIFGGEGNDDIDDGKSAAIVLGGDGNDILTSKNGTTLFIGGNGADEIVGGPASDLLISGYTSYDTDIDENNVVNEQALKAIMAVWNSNASYTSRVAALQDTNATYNLLLGDAETGTGNRSQNVFSDNDADSLKGGSGDDWFLANLVADPGDEATVVDTILDLHTPEVAQDIDGFVDTVDYVLAIGGASNIDEASVFSLSLNGGTTGATSYTIHWGDTSSTTISAAALAAAFGLVEHTYADGSVTRNITVDYTNGSGTFLNKANPFEVQVDNVAPTVVAAGASNVDEGTPYTLNIGAVTDPGVDTVISYTIDWGDGSDPDGDEILGETITVAALASAEGQVQHTYVDGLNTHVITVDVTDGDGTFLDRADFLSVQVDNVAPTVAISGDSNVDEGSPYTLNVGAVTDPGVDTVISYTINWGDGSDPETITAAALTLAAGQVQHTYADGPNTYAITVDVTDEDGTFLDRANPLSVQVDNVEPTVFIGGNINQDEGSVYFLTVGEVTDPGIDTVISYTIHWGDDTPDTTISAVDLAAAENQVQHTYADGLNTYAITVDVTDEDGTYLDRANPLSVQVDNVAPTVVIGGNSNQDEGSIYFLTVGEVTDPGIDTVISYTIHWGDDTPDTTISAVDLAAAENQVQHTYADGLNTYAITVDVTDEDGTYLDRANPLSVQVDNVAPTVLISGDSNVYQGSPYTLNVGAVTDPGVDTVSSYMIHWGDGTDTIISAEDLATASGQVQHTYAVSNTYVITVDLVDEDDTFLDRANALSVTVDDI
ncbi:MAG: PKD domain-containing protein [Planctomycetota bacterium]